MMKKVTITIEESDYKAFLAMCLRNGYKISTRIAILIKRDLERDKLDLRFQNAAKDVKEIFTIKR